jgi:uncharacterized protein YneF (UPF0154 family)
MSTHFWIQKSQKLYCALLSLYPKEHRDDYANSMRQVFTTQCHAAYEQRGLFGIILLWLRTLPDLGYTALLEHVTSPRASWGLMEPVHNAPLPWKGVFLILLPGLAYLAGQIAQLLTGKVWFYFVTYRVTFFLIIPPLIAWVITRRFPLWGLIPLGLFFRVVQEIGYKFIVMHPELFSGNPVLNLILKIALQIRDNLWLLVIPLSLITLLLGFWYVYQQKAFRSFWVWLGVYLLVAFVQCGQGYAQLNQTLRSIPELYLDPEIVKWLSYYVSWILYPTVSLLLLVFIGTFFARRHGFFAILILVGYVLPTTLMGLQDFNQYPNSALALGVFSAVILVYRSILTLVAPIWMSRSRLQTDKKRVIVISIATALVIHAVAQFYPLLLYPVNSGVQVTFDWIITIALDELKIISAFLLAIAMYQNISQEIHIPEKTFIPAVELTAKCEHDDVF